MVSATAKYQRISPLKLRKVVNLIRGRNLDESLAMLKMLPNKGAKIAYKVLHSARANYMTVNQVEDTSELKVVSVYVNQAPSFRRLLPRARGRADVLRKRNAHLTVFVG